MKQIMFLVKKHQLLLIALGIAFFSHLTYFRAGFVWIDHNDFEQKQAVVPLNKLPEAFFKPFGDTSFYRPLIIVVNSVDYAFFGEAPAGYHITNLVLHMFVVGLTGTFLSQFFKLDRTQKFIAQIFVAIHPMSILIIGAITRRQEPLAAIFIMLSLIIYVHAHNKKSVIFAWLSTLTFLAALFTKETSLFVIPSIIILWEIIQKEHSFKRNVLLWLWEIGAIGIYVIFRMRAVPEIWNTKSTFVNLNEYIGTRIGLIGKWIFYSINPLKPALTDAIPKLSLSSISVITTIMVLLVTSVFIFKRGLRDKVSVALIMLGLLTAPGLAVMPIPRIGTPNYGYLPAIGMAGIVGMLWKVSWNRSLIQKGIVIWFVIACSSTFISGDQFKNDETLFKPEVDNTYFPEGHYFLGNYYIQKQDYSYAKKEFEMALRQDESMIAFRNDPPSRINLASVLLQLGENEKARELFNQSLEEIEESRHEEIFFNMALTYYNEGNYIKTVELLSNREWQIKNAYLMLAESYAKLGQKDLQKKMLRKADSL